jgi:hypothetical protein
LFPLIRTVTKLQVMTKIVSRLCQVFDCSDLAGTNSIWLKTACTMSQKKPFYEFQFHLVQSLDNLEV